MTRFLGALAVWFVALVIICLGFAYGKSADVYVPRSLSIIGCETREFVWAFPVEDPKADPIRVPVLEVPEGYVIIPSSVTGYKDLEWNIVDGTLDCKREVVELADVGEIQGAPSIGADFSRAVGCSMAAMSYAPQWAEQHPGWWPIAVGCPNPIYSDNGTPTDTSDDRIVGYKIPECPRIIGQIEGIRCVFDESEI